MGESEASTPDAQAAAEAASDEQSTADGAEVEQSPPAAETLARLQARIVALEKKLEEAGKRNAASGPSLFTKIVVAVAVPLVPALFGFSQFMIQQQATQQATAHEIQKHKDKQLDDAIARFIAAETYEQRIRILEALRGLPHSDDWVKLMETLIEIVGHEGELLAESGQLAPAEAKRVDKLMAQTQQQLKDAKKELQQSNQQSASDGSAPTATVTASGNAVLPSPPAKPPPGDIASHVRRQFVRIALTTDCQEAIQSAEQLSQKYRQYLFEVYKQKDDRCALTIGGYPLSMAQVVVKQWRALKVPDYPQALVVSEVHFAKRHYP